MHEESEGGLHIWQRWFLRSRLPYIVTIILLFVCVGFSTWFISHRFETDKVQQAAQKAVTADVVTAQNEIRNGNFKDSINEDQSALSTAKTDTQKAAVYGNMALAASDAGNYSQAITYFTDEHTLDSATTGQDAMFMAQDYAYLKDNTDAIKYYNAALAYYKANPSKANPGADGGVDPRTMIETELQALK